MTSRTGIGEEPGVEEGIDAAGDEEDSDDSDDGNEFGVDCVIAGINDHQNNIENENCDDNCGIDEMLPTQGGAKNAPQCCEENGDRSDDANHADKDAHDDFFRFCIFIAEKWR